LSANGFHTRTAQTAQPDIVGLFEPAQVTVGPPTELPSVFAELDRYPVMPVGLKRSLRALVVQDRLLVELAAVVALPSSLGVSRFPLIPVATWPPAVVGAGAWLQTETAAAAQLVGMMMMRTRGATVEYEELMETV